MHPHTYSIYPYNKHTHSTYIVAQPEVGAVVVLHRLVWFLVFVQPFFPICALFILVHIFTEAEQYLPMWRFYQVQARKFKWNPLHHWSFFSANIMQLIFCSCTFFFNLLHLKLRRPSVALQSTDSSALCFSVWRKFVL